MLEENLNDALPETPNESEIAADAVDSSAENLENAENADVSNVEISETENDAETPEVPKSATLEEALGKCGIELPAKKVRLLKEYCELLWTWNERVNLTRHNDFDKFVSRDLVDSMQLAEQLQKGEHVLDVGSGGGVPGLVVAILRPDVVVELCDSTGKKAEALGAIVDGLGLETNVWYAKAEDLLKVHRFHTLTIRAVGKIYKLLSTFAPLWNSFDRILMIKGPNWADERGEARHYNALKNVALRKVAEYENPGAEHNSVILQFCRKSRFEEIERRAQDRAEGKPIDREVEPVEVDNKPRDFAERGAARGPKGSGRFSRGGNRNGNRSGRGFVDAKDRRGGDSENGSADGGDGAARVFARRSGKAPKGWTGKKREFRSENDGERGSGNGGGKRFGGGSGNGGKPRFGGGKSNGGFSKNRSSDRPRGGDR